MRNYLGQTLGLSAFLIALLAVVSVFPGKVTFGDWTLRKMDIFSAIRTQPTVPAPLATSSTVEVEADTMHSMVADTTAKSSLAWIDSVHFGRTFEDYTLQQVGMARFFRAVDSIGQGGKARIALFGDSFIEGDILAGDLRDSLQGVWGGAGVGFVPITSEVARYKRSLQHTFKGWYTHSILKKNGSHPPYGINGFVYSPGDQASVQYEGTDYFQHTRRWRTTRLFYHASQSLPFTWSVNRLPSATGELVANGQLLNVWEWVSGQADVQRFAAQFIPSDSVCLYGASLESGPGIYVDNFSVRGNTGGKLRQLQPALMRRFDALLHYDLIVVQLGMNAVTRTMDNIKWYRKELDDTFDHLRRCFPQQPILIVGVPDRADNFDGQLITMPSVPAIVDMQRQLARAHGFLFFDLYRWMGGPGTMIRFAERRPAWANRDYTHLTHEGGKAVGNRLARLFLEQYQAYRQLN